MCGGGGGVVKISPAGLPKCLDGGGGGGSKISPGQPKCLDHQCSSLLRSSSRIFSL